MERLDNLIGKQANKAIEIVIEIVRVIAIVIVIGIVIVIVRLRGAVADATDSARDSGGPTQARPNLNAAGRVEARTLAPAGSARL